MVSGRGKSIAMFVLSFTLFSCSNYSILSEFSLVNPTPGLKLTLSGSSVPNGSTLTLYPSGGTTPYSYAIAASSLYYSGTLGTISGDQFTAGTSIGSVNIYLSDSTGATVASTITIVPPTPTNFTAAGTSPSPAKIGLSWNYPTGTPVTSFNIMRSTGGAAFSQVGTVPATGVTSYNYPDSGGLNKNSIYIYYVVAVAGSYQSNSSVQQSAQP
ncbi:MAG TPA: hypothetical protein VMW73_06290 [Spirochaetia bacterium]|nr:hypothetical protein [Spirochaetia bacterium]